MKAQTFSGLAAAIDLWNADSWDAIVGAGSASPNPFTMLNVNALSDQVTRLIRKDCVHYEPPLYALTLTLDLAVVFGGLQVCPVRW